MTIKPDDPPADKPDPVVIDVYGIKLGLQPGDLGDPPPKSWADVRDQLFQHLLRLAVAPSRLVVELFEGVTRLIRGTSQLPAAVLSRVHRAHLESDLRERQAQARASEQVSLLEAPNAVQAIPSGAVTADSLVARMETILLRIRSRGHDGTIVLMRDGTMLVIMGTREVERAAIETAADEILLIMRTTDIPESL